eukprot:CAMPEP_0170466538 /NCGR_PEP_ID=MMETSP0123-20130129/10461_1 /TAXON_ID=182087 /ORGANISM="Favella ehrenbergii, Strain Fehren 1" /LENGTH=116 /DNA_ID=CAMNT_0010732693 /DNA_START=8 /DNA_END=358 /DNA_ORIENTATION=-
MIEDQGVNMATTGASQGSAAAKKGKTDPRDPDFVIKYEKSNFSKGDQEGGVAEFYQLVSVAIGMVAFLTRQKWACWVALFFYYTSSINARSDARLQHILTGISIVLIAFVNIYMTP